LASRRARLRDGLRVHHLLTGLVAGFRSQRNLLRNESLREGACAGKSAMPLTKVEVEQLYGRRARNYDWTANLYYAIGFREGAYRRKAVETLRLSPGDTVVELACGTGLNFPLLVDAVGPRGSVIGVDLTQAMLRRADARVRRHGWKNVRLVHSDVADFGIPEGAGGVISAFALTLVPEYEEVIARAAHALAPGKRLVVLDFKAPASAPNWVLNLAVGLTRPFGVTLDLTKRHPWESVNRLLSPAAFEELYFGFAYIVAGERPVGAGA